MVAGQFQVACVVRIDSMTVGMLLAVGIDNCLELRKRPWLRQLRMIHIVQ
jgi:hypothetical protein